MIFPTPSGRLGLSNCLSSLVGIAIWASAVSAASYPAIDPNLTASSPAVSPISEVDTSLSSFDRITLKVDGKPFFYNGVQLRVDKLQDVWGLTDDDIQPLFQQAADDGFTVVNSQIRWSDIQPDVSLAATESTYIRGGSSGDSNFANSATNNIGYLTGDENSKYLTYIKFNLSTYSEDDITAAKVRVYVSATAFDSQSFTASLYAITNNDWDASTITWNSGAPNHNGVDVVGTNGTDYFLASSSPSWDPILKSQYYDFDASDFVANYINNNIVSFILQASTTTTSTARGASIDGAKGAHPPQLILSRKDTYDWSYLDKQLKWAADANIKFEIVWFGSDSTGVTMDSRVPYYVMRNIKNEKVNSDGSHSPVFSKNTDPAYGVYWYLMDKNDLTTRSQEKAAMSAMMSHVAEYNLANGDKRTLIGVDVANEPAVQKLHGSGFTAWHNPATWGALDTFPSVQGFVDRTMWEFCINLANAVKESEYPVWTRANNFWGTDAVGVVYNEAMRATQGTSLDFIGFDPYLTDVDRLYKFGHENITSDLPYNVGLNLPMIMENSGAPSNAESLVLASLWGGSFYNVYELFGPDDFGLYVPSDEDNGDYTPVPRGDYVQDVVATNNMLKKISLLLASQRSVGAGGNQLSFFSVFSDDISGRVRSVGVSYNATGDGVGIVAEQSGREIVLLSTRAAVYTLSDIWSYGISSIESGYYDGSEWVKSGTVKHSKSGMDISFNIAAAECVRVVTRKEIPA